MFALAPVQLPLKCFIPLPAPDDMWPHRRSLEGLATLCSEAGLSNAEIAPIEIVTEFPDFEAFWHPFTLGTGPAPGYCMSLPADHGDALRAKLADRLDQDRPVRLTARAWAMKATMGVEAMASGSDHVSHLSAAAIQSLEEAHIRHPLNPASDVFLRRLAPIFGLERLALYLARVPPGKESFVFHHHERDEEFLVILSGRGRAEIGEEISTSVPGTSWRFPPRTDRHINPTNPFDEDLVYLMGGESSGLDIAHFPKIDKQLIFSRSEVRLIDVETSKKMSLADWQAVPSIVEDDP